MNYKDFFKEDLIKGGKGDNIDLSKFDPEELKMGIAVEKEHTNDNRLALEICVDHLTEDPHYYTRLNQAGLADELGNQATTSEDSIVEPNVDGVKKETVPGTVYPKVENETCPNLVGTIGDTSNILDKKSDVDKQATDPTPIDHVTGTISSTPTNPNILPKASGISGVGGLSVLGQLFNDQPMSSIAKDITIDIKESKKILKKLIKGSTDESMVPAAGNPSTDKAFVKGKRWTVKWKESKDINSEINEGSMPLCPVCGDDKEISKRLNGDLHCGECGSFF